MIQTLSATPTLAALRQRLAPFQQPRVEKLAPVDQVQLLGTLREAEQVRGAGPYYDAAADGQAKTAYYGDLQSRAEKLSPGDLYKELSNLVTSTHTKELDYDPSHNLYPVVDLRPDGTVHSIYADGSAPGALPADLIADDFTRLKEFEASRGDRANENGLQEGFHFNCEHVVPQSWFGKKSPMRGDLHHLFACDTQCNSLRGNSPYTDFPGDPTGDCGQTTAQHTLFEPASGKGAVARATLYFLLRYPGQIGDSSREYTAGDVDMLLKWSKEDPPGQYEFHRNAEIAAKQGNRNPLVDFPGWVDKIDFKAGLGKAGRSRNTPAFLNTGGYIMACPIKRPFSEFAR